MPHETHLLNEAYTKVRELVTEKQTIKHLKEKHPKLWKKALNEYGRQPGTPDLQFVNRRFKEMIEKREGVQTEAHFGLPPHLKREMDAYLEGDPNVHVDFFDDWVHEFLSSVGFPEAEEYKPEIYEYLKKGGHLVFDEPEHIQLARQTGRMRSGGGRFQSLYGG